MRDLIQFYYNYNTWASGQLMKALEPLSREEYTAPGCSGNGSIEETLAHLLTTQWGWFSWFDHSLPMEKSIALKVSPVEIAESVARSERWKSIDGQTQTFIQEQTDESLAEVWSFTTPRGISSSLPLWQMLMHVCNHATHTRAQIVAAIRLAGHNPGNYDLLNYAFTNKK